jgi:hypothetical protein
MKVLSHGFGIVAFMVSLSILATPGCNKPADKGKDGNASPAKNTDGKKSAEEHSHPEEGPHGGPLAEWGEEKYHAEFVVNHDKKEATVYILDGSAKKASPIAAETISLTITNVKPVAQITLKADPDKDDPKGSSSRFVGTHDKLGTKMDFTGEISGKVGNTPYAGTFEKHDHKDHKHEKKK